MWDFYVVVGAELLRCGLHEDGGISAPIARIQVKPGTQRLEWLEESGCLVLYGEKETIICDQTLSQTRSLPPIMGVSPDAQLAFALDGPGPSYDLLVLPLAGDKPLRITGVNLVSDRIAFLPEMDCLVLTEGDKGTDIPRNLLVVKLEQIREWLDDEVTHADRNALDYDAINGAKEMIPLDGSMKIASIPEHNGFICYWNIRTGGAATQGQLGVVEYLYWDDDAPARGQIRQASGTLPLDRFWLDTVAMERAHGGALGVMCTGVARKGGDFFLGIHTMAISEPEEGVRYQMQYSTEFDERRIKDVSLRHADSLSYVAPLPLSTGVMILTEDPFRDMRLMRVDIKQKTESVLHIDLDVTPGPFCCVGERALSRAALGGRKEAQSQHQLSSGFKGESTSKVSLSGEPAASEPEETSKRKKRRRHSGPFLAERSEVSEDRPSPVAPEAEAPVVDADVVDAEVIDADVHEPEPAVVTPPPAEPARVFTSPPAPVAPRMPAPTVPAPASPASVVISSGGPLPVMPGIGLDLPLGVAPADSHVDVVVVAVGGDARGSNLRWWLSQAEGTGVVVYQVHIRADSQVMVRWSARR